MPFILWYFNHIISFESYTKLMRVRNQKATCKNQVRAIYLRRSLDPVLYELQHVWKFKIKKVLQS